MIFAALLTLAASFFTKSTEAVDFDFSINADAVRTEEDYKNHIDFQKIFSYKNLNSGSTGYYDYKTSKDGLIETAGIYSDYGGKINKNDYPEFALAELEMFLLKGSGSVSDAAKNLKQSGASLGASYQERIINIFITLGLSFFLYIPFIWQRKRPVIPVFGAKNVFCST